ncbi:MAG: undecaprenyl/decaprenyl-phosphate alpha-N-acetylglucosaminyl 1-phosphate transferase [Clostridia bacterium]|nr:undecaprenyl/decaprenyl-phosphate alpha-N-acetylglucosaminyl 1-phosphate transferase [Clostridia bacterium]
MVDSINQIGQNTQLAALLSGLVAMLFAGLISFTTTPLVRVLAYKIGAIDVPKDNRRMHKKPMPLIGGVAIFLGFTLSSMLFAEFSPQLVALWFGGLVIVIMGVLDDVFDLNPFVKLAVQFVAAFIAVSQGIVIEFITIFDQMIVFGKLAVPITVLWIVGLTNAINIIDGLDGLSCGVSAICSLSLLVVTLMRGDPVSALLTAILAGSCLGFLPFNSNPAKIFMGDTGALFLGYTLAVISINGLFKFHALLSFMIPICIFGLPIFDITFAFIRRIIHGKNPFKGDRGHLHHRLVDMGFNVKQAVHILYAICGILGISAVMFTDDKPARATAVIVIGIIVLVLNHSILANPATRKKAGIDLPPLPKPEEEETANAEASQDETAQAAETVTEENRPDTPQNGG